jgi:thioredoxin reductase/NAD-dependent dihydropyrimidine dehydrogenase PreA subunit
MTSELTILLIYATPLFLILAFYLYKRKKQHRISEVFLAQAKRDGLTEPASIHPIIDPQKCIGCGSCVSACPEQNVLGLIDRHANLINPTNCIGHGACKTACPQNAISLVFGSATRGVDIPELNTDFQTNVPGIFIAGELGGMGLIKNAIEQGRQSMDSIAKYVAKQPKSEATILDCVIVGAGPAGLSAMLGAKEKQLNIVTIDQDVAGGTVSHFPRGKLVMTAPANMPIVGKVKFGEISKEKLLTFWLDLIDKHDLKINQNETMLDITTHAQGYLILTSSQRTYHSKSILLAIGRRGTPRKLGVKGEEHAKVVYRLIDAEQYEDEDILIVGGGDSALEAACSIAELGSCRVSISYRSDSFSRAKAKNRARIDKLVACGELQLFLSSQVNCISKDNVQITIHNEIKTITNSVVIVCAGGLLPTPFLKKTGIMVATKYGAE